MGGLHGRGKMASCFFEVWVGSRKITEKTEHMASALFSDLPALSVLTIVAYPRQ